MLNFHYNQTIELHQQFLGLLKLRFLKEKIQSMQRMAGNPMSI